LLIRPPPVLAQLAVDGSCFASTMEMAVGDADVAGEIEAVDAGAGARTEAEIPIAFVDARRVELVGEEQLVVGRGRSGVSRRGSKRGSGENDLAGRG